MAKLEWAEIDAWQLEQGAFPPICARSGEPATTTIKTKFEYASPVAALGLLLGLLPYFLIRAATSKKVSGPIPATDSVARRRRLGVRGGPLLLAVMLVAVIGSGSLAPRYNRPASPLWVLFMAVFFLGLLAVPVLIVVSSGSRVPGRLLKTGTVRLKVHPAFAAALRNPPAPGGVPVAGVFSPARVV